MFTEVVFEKQLYSKNQETYRHKDIMLLRACTLQW